MLLQAHAQKKHPKHSLNRQKHTFKPKFAPNSVKVEGEKFAVKLKKSFEMPGAS